MPTNTKTTILLFLGFFFIVFSSCKKEEGFGGKVSIKGTVINKIYDEDFLVLQEISPAVEEDVYIEFGDDQSVGDNVNTSSNGLFEFQFLTPGNYRIYVYSEDSVNHINTKKKIILKEINISNSDRTIDIGTLYKYKTLQYNEGNAAIKGKIMVRYFINNFESIREISPGQDEDVFLIYNDRPLSDGRERTIYNGSFAFTHLIKGHYKIFAYSDNPNGHSEKIAEYIELDITSENQVTDIGTIYINND
jgi:hypothetical protein